MKTYWSIAGGTLAVIAAIILIILLFRGCDSDSEKSKSAVVNPYDNKVNELGARVENLQIRLDMCCPEPKPLTLEERLEKAEKELAALRRSPRSSAPAPRKKTQSIQPRDVPETDYSGRSFTPAPSSSFQRNTSTGSEINAGQKVSFSGDTPTGSKFGTTVTPDRHRVYYLKDNYLRENGMSIPAPRLNGTDGPEFTFDSSSSYWFFIDPNTILSPSMINSRNYATIWCVYVGPIGTWDAFLPHESLKGEMKRVRGKEDGAITMDELYKMHQSNSEIWTDQNKTGVLLPKSFNPISGETDRGTKVGPQDGLIYQGWDFYTQTIGTVVTDKVNGQAHGTQAP